MANAIRNYVSTNDSNQIFSYEISNNISFFISMIIHKAIYYKNHCIQI